MLFLPTLPVYKQPCVSNKEPVQSSSAPCLISSSRFMPFRIHRGRAMHFLFNSSGLSKNRPNAISLSYSVTSIFWNFPSGHIGDHGREDNMEEKAGKEKKNAISPGGKNNFFFYNNRLSLFLPFLFLEYFFL